MKTYLLIHGSWHGGWCWDLVKKLLENQGHKVFNPTLPGMDYLIMPPPRGVGLKEHVEFVESFIKENNLDNIILVGHSYAGMIITSLAIRVPERISKLVYLDAFLPEPGQSLLDISLPERVKMIKDSLVDERGDTIEQGGLEPYLVPVRSPETFGLTDPVLRAEIEPKLVPTPFKTFTDKVDTGDVPLDIKKYYIRCTECFLLENMENTAKQKGFLMYRVVAGHDAMLTNPEELSNILAYL